MVAGRVWAMMLVGAGAALAAPSFPARAQAPDWLPARDLAARLCQGCHGMDGLSKQANAPHIAGQPQAYIVRQLHAYRDATRKDEQMSLAARELSDEQIALLAAYYSAVEIEAVKVPGR